MKQKTANSVMDYVEPMRDGGGNIIRASAWHAIALYFNAPLGLGFANDLAKTINAACEVDRKAVVLTLPHDEAATLGCKWITEKEMALLVDLSNETEKSQ